MNKIIHQKSIKRNWAELMPSIPTIGTRTIKRMYGYPQYFITPFSRLVKKHRNSGSSMVPCAMEYFPALQFRHPVWPSRTLYCPGTHATEILGLERILHFALSSLICIGF